MWRDQAMARHILTTFDRYQRERIIFVNAVADYAREEKNVQALVAAGGVTLLRECAQDTVPSVRHVATLALGRLASHSQQVAEALAACGFHTVLAAQLAGVPAPSADSKLELHIRRAAAHCLRGMAKHTPALAQQLVDGSIVPAVVGCLALPDPELQEAAAWILGNIAGHCPELAQLVAGGGAVNPLVAALCSPELAVQRTAAFTLSEIAKHTPQLAQQLADAGAVPKLAATLKSSPASDVKLKRQACCALGQIGKASSELAIIVAQSGALVELVRCLSCSDSSVRRHAAVALRDMVKLEESVAQAVADSPANCLPALVAAAVPGEQLLPAVLALGYTASYTAELALKAVDAGAVIALAAALGATQQDHIASAVVWALGQLGRHSAQHAKAVADAGVLAEISMLEGAGGSSEDLKAKSTKALSAVLSQLADLPALQQLVLRALPAVHLEVVLERIAAAIAANPSSRTAFVQSGALKAVEELGEAPGSPFKERMERITMQFPREIVEYYSPSYSKQLLSKLSQAPAGEPAALEPAASVPHIAQRVLSEEQ